jgi:TonB family protein
MGHITINPKFRLILWVTLLLIIPASATRAEGYLFGLGLHEETGRNIYLGGIYLADSAARPIELDKMPDPWVMEYRIVARRTSIRSLLGGMLLQSEVATGHSPGPATNAFADNILSSVKSSLYAGDVLEVQLKNNVTYAALNGQRLARSSNPEVAAYILHGWIGENGPNNAFRKELTASEINPDLLEQYNSTLHSPRREAEVAAWLGGPSSAALASTVQAPSPGGSIDTAQPETPTLIKNLPAATVIQEKTAAEFQPDVSAASAPDYKPIGQYMSELSAFNPATDLAADTALKPDPATATPLSTAPLGEEAISPGVMAIAAALPAVEGDGENSEVDTPIANLTGEPAGGTPSQLLDPAELPPGDGAALARLVSDARLPESTAGPIPDTARSLGVQKYSKRLARFHNQMIAKVHGEIRYPKRAVRRNLQGRLELDVSFSHDGELLEVEVALSSGHKILDAAATAAATDAFKNEMEEIDDVAVEEFGTPGKRLIVPIPVQFRLQ